MEESPFNESPRGASSATQMRAAAQAAHSAAAAIAMLGIAWGLAVVYAGMAVLDELSRSDIDISFNVLVLILVAVPPVSALFAAAMFAKMSAALAGAANALTADAPRTPALPDSD